MYKTTKQLNIRVPKELWAFIKKLSAEKEKSMNSIMIRLIVDQKKEYEKISKKLLTNENNVLS